MATYWVGAGGNDGNDGSTYALRKLTTGAALALLATKGDILNVVGTITMDAAAYEINGIATGLQGTSYSDPGFIIQGTDSSGNPALATLEADATHYAFLVLDDRPNYGIIRGLHFDYTNQPNVAGVLGIQLTGLGHIPLLVSSCQVTPSATAVASRQCTFISAVANWNATQPAGQPEVLVQYCYINKCGMEADNSHTIRADHCVYKNLVTQVYGPATFLKHNNNPSQLWPGVKMTNCTIDVYHSGGIDNVESEFSCLIDYLPDVGATNWDRLVHSNLLVYASSPVMNPAQLFNTGLISNDVDNVTAVAAGTVGYNYLVFDTGFTTSITGNTLVTFYDDHYNPDQPTTVDGTNLYVTDVRMDNTTLGALISDTGVTWTWSDADGYGYEIVLPKDYRVTHTAAATGALDGGPVGAIEEPVNQPPTGENKNYTTPEGVTRSVTASEGLLVNATDPNTLQTLSITGVGTPTDGTLDSYNTTTGSFVYTPDGFFVGTDSFVFKIYDGVTTSPEYTASIEVTEVASGGDTVSATYLDTAPFFRPILEVTTEFRMRGKKNRRNHHDLANYTEDRPWNESTHRVINLATSTTEQVNLGGVASAQYMIVETDNDIDVSINDTARYWSVTKCAAVALGQVNTIYIRNNSATNIAQVKLCVSD